MVDWTVIVEAPIGVLLLLVFASVFSPLETPLSKALDNSGNQGTIMGLVGLLSLVIAALIVFDLYKRFTAPAYPYQPVTENQGRF